MLRGEVAKLNGMLIAFIRPINNSRKPSSVKISFSLIAAGHPRIVSSAGMVRVLQLIIRKFRSASSMDFYLLLLLRVRLLSSGS